MAELIQNENIRFSVDKLKISSWGCKKSNYPISILTFSNYFVHSLAKLVGKQPAVTTFSCPTRHHSYF